MNNWQGKHAIVVGAARQGLAATRFFARQGAQVTLTDKRPESELNNVPPMFRGLPVKFVFGGHPLGMLDGADVLCLSGGVPLTLPLVVEAEKRGMPITNDSQIFMESVKAKVIGITGSAGKTTTTILMGAVAKAAMEPCVKVWVGGNIGLPMIDNLEEIEPEDWVVLELSSFQLDQMTISPQIAVILNITPNHLDRHKSMQAYTEAKARILDFQDENGIAILNREDSGAIELKDRVNGRLITFGFSKSDSPEPAVFIQNDFICFTDGNLIEKLASVDSLKLPGRHNLANAMAACAVGAALGFDPRAMQEGIESVTGVPHRLELIREKDGIRWFNDSIATAPERVMAAIEAIGGSLVLLLGGRDKDLPWDDLARTLHEINPKVILFGEAAQLIQNALQAYENGKPPYPVWKVNTLSEAVRQASDVAVPGESVLLSPGGTSFDAYKDFEARGEHFRQLVEELA
jgi:UDP-N-acetylmuramoylalanine--D-glutamate ligase